MSRKPLDGVHVLVLGQFVPAPYCAHLLMSLGARVTKIEPPGGDALLNSQRGLYRLINAGFSVVRADLKEPRELEVVSRTLISADVVIESFRPGKLRRFGLDAESVRARQPSLVYCSMSGYGQTGPKRQKVGHDLTYLAWSGVLSLPVDEQGSLARPAIPLADASVSVFAALSVTAALLGRERTGTGCHVDVSLAESSLALGILRAGWLGGDVEEARGFPHLVASSDVYVARSGRKIAISLHEDHFWNRFVETIRDNSPQIEDVRFRHLEGRQVNSKELRELLTRTFLSLDESYLERLVQDDDLPIEWVQGIDDALFSDQGKQRRLGIQEAAGFAIGFPAAFDGYRATTKDWKPLDGVGVTND